VRGGVGFSQSIYRWSDELSADAGFLRLVAGLEQKPSTGPGWTTEACQSRQADITILTTTEEKHRFSQRRMDIIEYSKNAVSEIAVTDLIAKLPKWYVNLIAEHDYDSEREFRERGQMRDVCSYPASRSQKMKS
jgi:hypothetical protein